MIYLVQIPTEFIKKKQYMLEILYKAGSPWAVNTLWLNFAVKKKWLHTLYYYIA